MSMSEHELRWYSSVEEARDRGLTGPDSPFHGRIDDSAAPRNRELPPLKEPAPSSDELEEFLEKFKPKKGSENPPD